MSMSCPDCLQELEEPVDEVHSNYDSKRYKEGETTGYIYKCEACDALFIKRINGSIDYWNY